MTVNHYDTIIIGAGHTPSFRNALRKKSPRFRRGFGVID